MEWQPIETAPENTYVLVWSPQYWSQEYGLAVLDDEEGWLTYELGEPLDTPSHWAHLPGPPPEED